MNKMISNNKTNKYNKDIKYKMYYIKYKYGNTF